MPQTRFSALFSLLLVFASGILVGAVGYRLYVVNAVATAPPPRPQRDPEDVRKHIVADMRARIKLDDQQVQQLDQIYDRTRLEFDALHKKGSEESRALWDKQKDEIRAILRPDQIPLYEAYQKERDDQHRRDREHRQKADGKGLTK